MREILRCRISGREGRRVAVRGGQYARPPGKPETTGCNLLLRRVLQTGLSTLFLALSSGCFQIETLVKVEPDGSAIITERYQLSRRVLEFKDSGGKSLLAPELTREAVIERMRGMGKGVSLVRHEVRDGDEGSRESVAVFKIPDVSELRYASPFLAIPGYPARSVMKCSPAPRLQGNPYLAPGYVCLKFDPVALDAAVVKAAVDKDNREKRRLREMAKAGKAPKGPTPAELQALRRVQPMIRDMLKGIQLTFTVECYAPVKVGSYGPLRNQSAGTKRFDLIDFSDTDLDASGSSFLENEEILLELQQMKLNGPNIRRHLKGYGGNLTLPLFHAQPPALYHIRPSRYYFDKFFAGKTIGQYGRKETQKPALFEKIGFTPAPE